MNQEIKLNGRKPRNVKQAIAALRAAGCDVLDGKEENSFMFAQGQVTTPPGKQWAHMPDTHIEYADERSEYITLCETGFVDCPAGCSCGWDAKK